MEVMSKLVGMFIGEDEIQAWRGSGLMRYGMVQTISRDQTLRRKRGYS